MIAMRGHAGALRKFRWTVAVKRAGRTVYPYAYYETKERAERLRQHLVTTALADGPFRVVPEPSWGRESGS